MKIEILITLSILILIMIMLHRKKKQKDSLWVDWVSEHLILDASFCQVRVPTNASWLEIDPFTRRFDERIILDSCLPRERVTDIVWRTVGASRLLTLWSLWSWGSSSLALTYLGCLVMICGLGWCPPLVLSVFQQHIMPYGLLCLLTNGLIWSVPSSDSWTCIHPLACSVWSLVQSDETSITRFHSAWLVHSLWCPFGGHLVLVLSLLLFGPLFFISETLIPTFRIGLLSFGSFMWDARVTPSLVWLTGMRLPSGVFHLERM